MKVKVHSPDGDFFDIVASVQQGNTLALYLFIICIEYILQTSLKLVDKFVYLGSSISSTESDINMRLAKTWTAIDRLSIIWKSDLSNKIKQFLPSSECVISSIQMHHMDADKAY